MRKCSSWIESFVDYSSNTGSPEIYRRWAAITTLAATLEQKVWISTGKKMYPNIYTFLVGPPGIGKSYIMSKVRELLNTLKEPHIAPTSINVATLVDQLNDFRCQPGLDPTTKKPLDYNSMLIMVSEFGTFLDKYEDGMMAVLTDMYDVEPYGQRRRGSGLKLNIASPQINMIIGVTPAALMKYMPDTAWDQGFASRILFIYSNDKIIIDDFAEKEERPNGDLAADLQTISSLIGPFHVHEHYRQAVNEWRESGENPKPKHPRLTHYLTRRKAHIYRLSMIASIDKGDSLWLTLDDFNTAMRWLLEAEEQMGTVFESPSDASDVRAMEEIEHFILKTNMTTGRSVPNQLVVDFARRLVPAHAVMRVLYLIKATKKVKTEPDRFGVDQWTYLPAGHVEEEVKELRPLE